MHRDEEHLTSLSQFPDFFCGIRVLTFCFSLFTQTFAKAKKFLYLLKRLTAWFQKQTWRGKLSHSLPHSDWHHDIDCGSKCLSGYLETKPKPNWSHLQWPASLGNPLQGCLSFKEDETSCGHLCLLSLCPLV